MSKRIQLKDIVKGQTFWEVDCGASIELIALENAHPEEKGKDNPGFGCSVSAVYSNETTDLWEAEDIPSHYRLKLYEESPYL